MNIGIRDIRYFLAIVESGHLGRAAAFLGRSQPALTKCIRRLEAELGAAIFDRSGRGMVLTSVGKAFHLRALQVRDANDRYFGDLKGVVAGSIGKVRIGCGPIAVDYLLPMICNRVLQHEPSISLELMIGTTYFLKEQIRQDKLDLIVGGVSNDDEFINLPLIDEAIVVVARQGHPIFLSSEIALHDLLNYQWILPTVFLASRRWLDTVFSAQGLDKPHPQIETNAIPTVQELIGSTDLLSFVSRLTIEHPKNRGMLKEIALKETTLERRLGIIYPKGSLAPATMRLIDLLD